MSTPGVLFNLTHCLYLDALLSCTCLLYSSLEHTHTSFENTVATFEHTSEPFESTCFFFESTCFFFESTCFFLLQCPAQCTCLFNMLKCPTHVCSIRYNVNTCVFNDYTCRMIDWLIVNHGISLLGGTTLLLCYIIIIIYYLLYLSVHSSNTLFYCDALNVIYLFHVFQNLHSPYI